MHLQTPLGNVMQPTLEHQDLQSSVEDVASNFISLFDYTIIIICTSLFSVVCDEVTVIGEALSIEIRLRCPDDYPCQNTTRMIDVYNRIYNAFVSTKNLTLVTDDERVIALQFCKISIDSNGK